MYIAQKQLENLQKLVSPNKVVVIYGPRRCGKTTLIKKFLETAKQKYLLVSGEDVIIQEYLSSQSIAKLKNFVGDSKLLVIDEAQKIKNIGVNLKLIVDHIPGVSLIATGSSAFDLAHHIGEPLTGRKYTLKLFPLAQLELALIEAPHETAANVEHRLIFGSYPEVILAKGNSARERYLKEIAGSYLYKDILELDGVKYSDKIARLLQLLAFQIGKEVSLSELGTQLGMSKNTVERYLDLLEKTFVIYKISGFSRNLRKEISKSSRFYFYDNGIRNVLINNFNMPQMRNDIGQLWENYVITERIKKQEYRETQSHNYFWRTYDQKEIDWVEEREGKLFGYEVKWRAKAEKPPKEWLETYANASYTIINNNNYLDFIT